VTCLQEVRERNYKGPHSYHIMSNDIEGGADELGVLLMGHDYKSWWCGTVLSIDRARQLLPGQNATTLQVAASVLGAVSWMIRNPRSGVRLPDELPDDEILAVAEFYLGNVPSLPLDWVPTVPGEVTGHPREDATWQFDRFLIGADERDPSGDRITGARLLREHTDLRDYCQRASSRG
jgi:homospermidine synthase